MVNSQFSFPGHFVCKKVTEVSLPFEQTTIDVHVHVHKHCRSFKILKFFIIINFLDKYVAKLQLQKGNKIEVY